MERRLALIAGTGEVPGHAAAEARRQGWQVIAFPMLGDSPELAASAHELVPASLTDLEPVLGALSSRAPQAVLFCGKFRKEEVFAGAAAADRVGRTLIDRGFSDLALQRRVVSVLEGLGIEVLDQRDFLASRLITAPCLTSRQPSAAEWEEVRAGFRVARAIAALHVGQTVVQACGVTVAVEAMEGTDEAIRRGTHLAGPGAVVVKAIGPDNDYRFDVPAIGPSTLAAAADGGAAVVAVERGRVMVVDRDAVVRRAQAAGIALVSLDGEA